MERLLALETSTHAFSVALLSGGRLVEAFELSPQRHAEKILPTVEKLLSAEALALSDLEAIAFGRGPGSFIGIRIATGVAQGLAFGLGRPLVPISSLLALAWPTLKEKRGTVLAVMDARMGEVYAAYFRWEGERVVTLGGEWLGPLERLPLLGCGCSAVLCQVEPEALSRRLGQDLQRVIQGYPRATAVAELARLQGIPIPPEAAQPTYLRKKVVQEQGWSPLRKRGTGPKPARSDQSER